MNSGTANALSGDPSQNLQAPEEQRVNILIVDDLPEKLMVYEAILQELGQNLIMVRSGEEALKLVLAQEFAAILLDVNMPGMDGFETAALIRQRKRSSHTPIIFLTAFTDEMRMAQGYASGAVDYLPTPVVPEVLRAKVRVFIELSQMRRQAASQAEERARRAAAEEAARRSEFMAKASEMLTCAPNEQAVLQTLARLPVPYLADACMVWIPPSETRPAQQEWCWIDLENGTRSTSLPESDLLENFCSTINEVSKTGCPVFFRNFDLSKFPFLDGPEALKETRSVVLLPIARQNHSRGVLFLVRKKTGLFMHDSDTMQATELAARAAVCLEKVMLLERIQEADQRKNEFIAMLAHELRNPLAPIRNALYIMKLDDNPALQQSARDTIERQLDHMIHLVDDLMDVSRITKGKIELRKGEIQLEKALNHAIETASSLIRQHNHTLKTALPDHQIWLDADYGRIAQIFSNLLNNAAKYTDDGGMIELEAKENKDSVIITVRDNGIGIPAAMRTRIFDIFSQVDSTLERRQGGLGIGLTLVKNLVEMHGGRIDVRSEGRGSEFIVTLPTIPAPKDITYPSETLQKLQTSSIPVLVVDDNVDSAKTLGWMIEFAGHDYRLAHDGASAIEIAKTYRPKVVLLDIGLPNMSGYEVCKTMREQPGLEHTIFIAQTGWGQAEHRRRSKEAGFDHHFVKPVNIEALKEVINSIAQ